MPIPSEADLLDFAKERSGKTIDQLKKEVAEYAQQFAPLVKKQTNLVTYLYIKNQLAYIPKIKVTSSANMLTLDELLQTSALSRLSTQGYVYKEWEFKTTKGDDAIGFLMIDKTGTIGGRSYWGDGVEKWRGAKVKAGDFIQLKNININLWKNKKEIRVLGGTNITKLEANDAPYQIGELITPIEELNEEVSALIAVTILNLEESTYPGCPYCFKHIKNTKAGQRAMCPNEKRNCGEVLVKDIKRISALATDGEADITIEFAPWVVDAIGESVLDGGGLLYIIGAVSGGKLNADFALEAGALGYSGEKIQKRFESKPETIDAIVPRIPLVVQSWNGRTEQQIVDSLVKHIKASPEDIKKAIAINVEKEKIKLGEDDVYRIV